MSRSIELEYVYPHPPEHVWRALTDSDALSHWFMENDFEPALGHEFTFRTDPAPGFDGVVHCKVLEIDPPRHLRFSWRGGPIDTVVTWALDEEPRGTRFRMTQEGFDGLRPFLVSLLLKSGGKKLYGEALPNWLADQSELPAGARRCWRRRTRFFARAATAFARTDSTNERD